MFVSTSHQTCLRKDCDLEKWDHFDCGVRSQINSKYIAQGFQQFDLKLIDQSPPDRTVRKEILGTNLKYWIPRFKSKKSKNLMSI